MRKLVYLLLTFIPLVMLARLADSENYSPIEYAYADVPSAVVEGTNCNSDAPGSAPGGSSS